MLILCYLLLSFFLVNLLASYRNFALLTFKQGKLNPVFAGENAELPVWISSASHKDKSAHGRIHVHLWGETDAVVFDLDTPDNPTIVSMPCPSRGVMKLPRITFNSYYPFGLFRTWTHLSFSANQWVYPAPLVAPTPMPIESQSQHEAIKQELSNATGQDEFDSLKDYRVGEPLHHVAWKQVAKGRGMISKVFSSNQAAEIWLVLDSVNELEKQLSEFSYLVQELSKEQQYFGLRLGQLTIEPAVGEEHRKSCLEALSTYKQP